MKDRYIPCGYSVQEFPEYNAVVASFANAHGYVSAMAYSGKRSKPDWHYSFRSVAAKDLHVEKWLVGLASSLKFKQERKELRNKAPTLKVGDILYTSWGYDQTNVSFYQVVTIPSPKSVMVRQLAQKAVETGFMSGTCVPIKGKFLPNQLPLRRFPRPDNSIKIDDVQSAWLWDGTPKYWSSYA